MMRPEQAKRRIVGEWLGKAEADMRLAEHLVSEGSVYPGAIAFHSQQAAEKYLKAFLVWIETHFPKTHDLKDLLDLVEPVNRELAAGLRDVIVLTRYGVELRYPGDRPELTPAEAREAARLAQRVRDAVLPLLPKMPSENSTSQ